MFVNNLDPTLFNIGPFEVRFYGIVYVIGFFLAYFLLEHYRKKGQFPMLTNKDIDDYIFYLMLGIICGARLFEVLIWEPGYYFTNPSEILKIWHGGLAFHGALIGGFLVTYWFCKKKNAPFARFLDVVVLAGAFGMILGRIANFINGEIWGTITNVWWCVKFKAVEGCRHPVQLYNSFLHAIIFGILWYKISKPHKDGMIFWLFVLLSGFGRFVLDFWREDVLYFGLSTGQYLSAAMFVVATIVLWKYYYE